MIDAIAQWGYPIGEREIKELVKTMLDQDGTSSNSFVKNRPGNKWLKSFAERHNLATRSASCIKHSRASVNSDTINFFDHSELAICHLKIYLILTRPTSQIILGKKVYVKKGA